MTTLQNYVSLPNTSNSEPDLDEFVNIRTKTAIAGSAKDQHAPTSKPIKIYHPDRKTIPFVFASPHSGRDYPDEFVSASRLDPVRLRRSEDSFVDELFACAPDVGAPLLAARYPRAYVDPNREAYELDPSMFDETLPGYVTTNSARVSAGLGTVARVVTNGEEIYRHKLTFAEVKWRIENVYKPYHHALQQLIGETKEAFGKCILVDCHSMPSTGGPLENDSCRKRVDIVLGNNHGTSCAPELMNFVDERLTQLGLRVRRNNPYSGGYTTRHYGCPWQNVHTLQVEINRALYMDEVRIRKHEGFADVAGKISTLLQGLTDLKSF